MEIEVKIRALMMDPNSGTPIIILKDVQSDTMLPIWVDEATGDFEVIGSREELKARAAEGWEKFDGHPPHRPWIDLIKIKNPKTGNLIRGRF